MADSTQTFSESWYRVAEQRICLRPGVKVRRQNFRGERWFVLENPLSNQFFRIRPMAYELVARLRPDRTVEEVWQECLRRFPNEAPGQEAVIQLLAQLYQANLLQYNLASDTTQLFQRFERTRQRETRARLLNIMFMRFPLLDPDTFLIRLMPLMRRLLSPLGALLWLVVVGLAVKTGMDHWPELRREGEGVLDPNNLFLLYAGMAVIKTIHEFGHAFFCRRFGGEVHVMGIMLMIFTPVPYVDATSSWGFRDRSKRILVGAGGMIFELFVAALAMFVWAKTSPGTLHGLAYNMMIVASVSTVLFNINPLMRFDGYYILSDLLDIPNLTQRATKQIRALAERHLFGVRKVEFPAQTRQEAAWLTGFGVGSALYRVVIFAGMLLVIADRFQILGLIMTAFCAVSWIAVPLVQLTRYLATSPVLARTRSRAIGVSVGLALVIFGVLQFVPLPHHFRAPGVLKSQEWSELRNNTAGHLQAVLAQPGSTVTNGQPLLQLGNPELALQLQMARASVQEVQARLLQAMRESSANLKPLNSRLEFVQKRLHRLEEDQAALVVRSPLNGTWSSRDIQDYVGRWLPRGAELGVVISPKSFQFVAIVAQEDVNFLFAKSLNLAEIRLFGESARKISARDVLVIPADRQHLPSAALGWASGGEVAVTPNDPGGRRALEPFFEVRAPVQDPGQAHLLHGRAGRIRFDLEPEPLLPRWGRSLRQLLQKRYQL